MTLMACVHCFQGSFARLLLMNASHGVFFSPLVRVDIELNETIKNLLSKGFPPFQQFTMAHRWSLQIVFILWCALKCSLFPGSLFPL